MLGVSVDWRSAAHHPRVGCFDWLALLNCSHEGERAHVRVTHEARLHTPFLKSLSSTNAFLCQCGACVVGCMRRVLPVDYCHPPVSHNLACLQVFLAHALEHVHMLATGGARCLCRPFHTVCLCVFVVCASCVCAVWRRNFRAFRWHLHSRNLAWLAGLRAVLVPQMVFVWLKK